MARGCFPVGRGAMNIDGLDGPGLVGEIDPPRPVIYIRHNQEMDGAA
jgi:hypothetical protein